MKTYQVNEIFFSLLGEGVRCGTANLFLRFAGCNQSCSVATHGFDCDTDFATGRDLTIGAIIDSFRATGPGCEWIVLTGGEPALQLDADLIVALHQAGYRLAVETNGSIALPDGLDWITVSPKVPESQIRQRCANEVKYVRALGQEIPNTVVQADHYLISPAFQGHQLGDRTLQWCIQLVKDNPPWRLSVQMHKQWGIR